ALLRRHKPRGKRQWGGFAPAIGPRHQAPSARPDRKSDAAKDLPAPSTAREIGTYEPHHLRAPGARPQRHRLSRKFPGLLARLAASLAGTGNEKTLISMPMSLASVDFLERHKKRPYKPSSRAPYQPALDS